MYSNVEIIIEVEFKIILTHILSVKLLSFLTFHVTVHRVIFLIIKPTTCTDFSDLFLE